MKTGFVVLCLSLLTAAVAGVTIADESGDGFVHYQNDDVPYVPDSDNPELGYVVLSGDPAEEGVYVIRLRIPPGHTFPPHYHDKDRFITVISGVWAFGKGTSGRCEDTIPLTAGAYVMHPRGGIHYDGACGDGLVEVQIIGQGPVTTTWVEATDL